MEVVTDSCPQQNYGRWMSPHCCKLLHSSAESNCEMGASQQGQTPCNMDGGGFVIWGSVTRH
jgi:hypothetical protein